MARQQAIPTVYFRNEPNNRVLLPADDFCGYVAFIMEMDVRNANHLDVIERCVKRFVNYCLTENHRVLEYRDDFDHLLNSITELVFPIKGLFPSVLNATTIQVLADECNKIFEFYVTNDWGLYDITVHYPEVYSEYLGDYRIIKWSMSEDAICYSLQTPKSRIKETFHTLRRT